MSIHNLPAHAHDVATAIPRRPVGNVVELSRVRVGVSRGAAEAQRCPGGATRELIGKPIYDGYPPAN